MPTLTIEYQSDAERLVLEQAIAYVQGINQLALSAPHGTVLDACEQLALNDGRQLLRDSLAAALQNRVEAIDAPKKCPDTTARDDTHAGS